ncbi:MAG: MBL fold metallo-hydrolase [Clostridia bacterium]|nr:MBL fold metallo-hydrolase [Clostridia bacterium]
MADVRYDVKDIGDGSYLISEKFSTMYIICGSERALLIDCGLGAGDYKALAEELTRGLPYDLVATHAHVDHIGGRGQFHDMYISAFESRHIKDCGVRQRRRWLAEKKLRGKAAKDLRIRAFAGEPRVHIIGEGDTFDLGGGRVIEVLATPGHTEGSISLYDNTYKTLFVGDVISSYLYMWLKTSTTIDRAIETMRRINEIDFSVMWASHHWKPFDRARFAGVAKTAALLAKKKNSFFPFVRRFAHNGNQIFYRANNIHARAVRAKNIEKH